MLIGVCQMVEDMDTDWCMSNYVFKGLLQLLVDAKVK